MENLTNPPIPSAQVVRSRERKALRVAGVAILAILMIGLASTIAMQTSVWIFGTPMTAPPWVMPVLMHASLLLLSALVVLIFGRGRWREFGVTRPRPWPAAAAITLSLGVGLAANALMLLSGAEFNVIAPFGAVQTVLFIWIWASVAEESFCRGAVQTLFRRALCRDPETEAPGFDLPVFFAALIFTFMHLPLVMMGVGLAAMAILLPAAFVLGVIAGLVRKQSGSLLPAIIVHALFNVSGSITAWLVG